MTIRSRMRSWARLASLAVMLLVLSPAGAQPVQTIGVLLGGAPPPADNPCLDAFRRALEEMGYAEGKTHRLEPRWSGGRVDAHFENASELDRLGVDVVVAMTTTSALGAKRSTSTIPIVMGPVPYPVELNLVTSLPRPGGNVTGTALLTPELLQKRVQVLKEAVPAASLVVVLRSPGAVTDHIVKDYEAAAKQLALRIHVIRLERVEDLAGAFKTAVQKRAHAVLLTQSPMFQQHRAQIAELGRRHRLPVLSGEPDAAEAGALIFHGTSVVDACHRAATFVDRILKGTKPADLPIEQPTKVELIVNLKTAKPLGLTLPQSILARAERVIE
jgi:putative ABC transport system substrate-binding protein